MGSRVVITDLYSIALFYSLSCAECLTQFFSHVCDLLSIFFFFFQAEDGIRDPLVTGVQTCALPIFQYIAGKISDLRVFEDEQHHMNRSVHDVGGSVLVVSQFTLAGDCRKGRRPSLDEIGRASCRERVEVWGVAGALKKKQRVHGGAC